MSAALPQRRFPWLQYWLGFAVIVLLAVWPLVSVLISASIAESHGCRLDEGSAHACIVWGSDWGGVLYTMAVMGWLMLATLPLGGGALLVWIVVLAIHYLAWRKQEFGA